MGKKSGTKFTAGFVADELYNLSGEMGLFSLKVEANPSLSKMKLRIDLFPECFDDNGPNSAYGIYEYFEDMFTDLKEFKGTISYDEKNNQSKYRIINFSEVAVFIFYFIKYLDDNKEHAYIRQIDDIDKFIKQVYRHLVMLEVNPQLIS